MKTFFSSVFSVQPVIGLVQDSLLACKLFSQRDTFLTKDEVMNILMWVDSFDGNIPVPAILKPKPLWTGKQIFSMILPKITLRAKSGHHPDVEHDLYLSREDSYVIIDQGVLIAGTLDKATVSKKGGGIVHLTWVDHGPLVAQKFLHDTQLVVNYWLMSRGYEC